MILKKTSLARRTWLTLASTLAMGLSWSNGWAQTSPTVRLVVGYSAGGPVDAAARLLAPALARELGQNVVVENRPGAAGALGGDAVAKSSPQAMMFFFAASPTMTITPHVIKSMPFDPLKDLVPIAPILSYANVLVVNNDQPFKTVPELVAYAKAHPGKVAYGSAGMGASNHLSGELFALRTGTQLTHVPYKGNAPAMTDVMGGQIQMMFDIVGGARGHIAAGRVRPMAVTSRERNAGLPQVVSMKEAGIEDYDVGGWYALYGPPRMEPELIKRINDATRQALSRDDVKARLIELGYDLWVGPPSLVTERATRELALWGTVTKGIKFD